MSRLFFILLLLTSISTIGQETWTIYDTTNSPLPHNQVQAIAVDQQNTKWIGTGKGLARFNNGQWTIYNTANAPLPSNEIYSLAIDHNGTLWIGTNKGLASFDGQQWKNFLPDRMVNKLVYDQQRRMLWISIEKALLKYDGSQFTQYDVSNSLLFDTYIIKSIAVDQQGIVYIGAFDTFQFNGRLITFDGTNWNLIKLEMHTLTSAFPYALIADAQNKIWMGTGGTTGGVIVQIVNGQWQINEHIPGANALLMHNGHLWAAGVGLSLFDGKEWKRFDTRNSPLPDDYTYALGADKNGAIWTGTISGGVAVYTTTTTEAALTLNNYPNPFPGTTTIQFEIPSAGLVELKLYNAQGQLLKLLVNGHKPAGRHTIESGQITTGIYFCALHFNGKRITRTLIRN